MKSNFKYCLLFCFTSGMAICQEDTSIHKKLEEISIIEQATDLKYQNEVQGTTIYSGKKNEVIRLGALDADLSTNNSRQVFGKVPGISIWESDGSGIQVGIAARGLSPNRSWEFNVRQNGYDISSEAYGYPEAYYTPPMEALEKIEILRGAASLQYGTQFGGLVNYVVKKKLTDKKFGFESSQTYGSYGLFNSFNAVGGQIKKFSYYAYLHHRNADGWRENSNYKINTGFVSLNYEITPKIKLGLEYTHMNYESQQPGGLTDSLFYADPKQSLRSRNWMSTPWNSTAINLDYEISKKSKLNIKIFNTYSQRNSVGYTKSITTLDNYNTSINSFNARQVDRDAYNNLGAEIRFLKTYSLFSAKSYLAAGVRVYNGQTRRKQQGIGTTGDDFDLSITTLSNGKEYAKSFNFGTKNLAFFLENVFKLTNKLSLTPGVRYEMIESSVRGYLNTTSTGEIASRTQNRNVLLLGIGAEFDLTENTNFYGNFSQAFRPVTFSELTPSATTDSIDANMKDATGYNLDFGYRGSYKNIIRFDIGGFMLSYENRIGTIPQGSINFKTNIGSSVSKGIESFVEVDLFKIFTKNSSIGSLKVFCNYSLIDAKYTSWNNPSIINDPTKSIEGKQVENAPKNTIRAGATYKYKSFSITYQYNKVDAVFTDAANTVSPNATATVGKLPAYEVMDLSLTYKANELYTIKTGVNNLTDAMYATRRASGYPGPGILPANGRTMYLTLSIKL